MSSVNAFIQNNVRSPGDVCEYKFFGELFWGDGWWVTSPSFPTVIAAKEAIGAWAQRQNPQIDIQWDDAHVTAMLELEAKIKAAQNEWR